MFNTAVNPPTGTVTTHAVLTYNLPVYVLISKLFHAPLKIAHAIIKVTTSTMRYLNTNSAPEGRTLGSETRTLVHTISQLCSSQGHNKRGARTRDTRRVQKTNSTAGHVPILHKHHVLDALSCFTICKRENIYDSLIQTIMRIQLYNWRVPILTQHD